MKAVISQNTCLSDATFIHKGDLDAIGVDIIQTYFGGELSTLSPSLSCAYKHILAYLALIEDRIHDDYLILEDDIILSNDFCSQLQIYLQEAKARNLSNYIISLEDSNLKYVEGSLRKKNIYLYEKEMSRTTGAYLVDKTGAISMMTEIHKNKCNYPIDWFHNYCSKENIIQIFWAHPTIATQGSLNGSIESIIGNKKYGKIKHWIFNLSRLYKKVLYWLR